MIAKSRFPERDCIWRNGKACRIHLSNAARSATRAGPRKKSDRGSGPTGFVPVIKVISRWIIEIHGAFGKTQSEHVRVEIDVVLRITGDGGDMMNPAKLHLNPQPTNSAQT